MRMTGSLSRSGALATSSIWSAPSELARSSSPAAFLYSAVEARMASSSGPTLSSA
jgi:hypothetical protein